MTAVTALRVTDLGAGPALADVLARVAGWPSLVCLYGEWADSDAVIASHPVAGAPVDRDAVAALDDHPAVEAADADRIGGGWFGRLDFDAGTALAYYDHVVRLVDGRWCFESLWCAERADALAARLAAWRAVLSAEAVLSGDAVGAAPEWRAEDFDGPAMAEHLDAVERAVEQIRAGELYQVNVCTRLHARFEGSGAGLFAAAVVRLRPRFGAYVSGVREVVSFSPELFVQRRGRDVRSAPIKGTLPRTPGDDNAAALRRSAKDTAENVMIVDLVRNDLGRVCEVGSVRAGTLLEVQPHPGVWHLVSEVAGRLRPDVGDAALLAATFPPGSVTGAPKVRAQSVIRELERYPRGTYTGAIGFASPLWGAQWSVAIRTFEIAGGRIELGVGGGITADSVPMLEWRECLHKAAPLIAAARSAIASHLLRTEPDADPGLLRGGLLETLLCVDGLPVRLADHLARLDRSCRELYGTGLPAELAGDALEAAKTVPVGPGVLRVVVSPLLRVSLSAAALDRRPTPMVADTVQRSAGLWRHKWADRSWAAGVDSALFVAADGAVLETTRGNVFLVEADGTLVTPPLRGDLLPGITRRALLDHARDVGRPTALRTFDVAELIARPAFWTSSLSGAVPIHRVNGHELPRDDGLVAGFRQLLTGGAKTVR